MAVGRLLFVRHGVTIWNRDERLQGQLDIPLSDAGRGQAVALGRALAGIPLDAAYTSDLTRASETAALCLVGRDVALHSDARLRERDYGVWQGRLRRDIAEINGIQGPGQAPSSYAAAPAGGESWRQLQRRVAVALDEMARGNAGRSLLIVGHGGTLRAAFCHLLRLPGTARRLVRVDNACICEFEAGEGENNLVRWNDTHHLA